MLGKIKKALDALGVTGSFDAERIRDLAKVVVNGEYFGLFDIARELFVE